MPLYAKLMEFICPSKEVFYARFYHTLSIRTANLSKITPLRGKTDHSEISHGIFLGASGSGHILLLLPFLFLERRDPRLLGPHYKHAEISVVSLKKP